MEQVKKFGACPGPDGLHLGIGEGVPYLLVQVDAVGDDDDPGIGDPRVQCEGMGEHDHGEGFAAPLGVPYEPPLPGTVLIVGLNALQGVFYGEILLVTADFLNTCVIESEAANELKQACRREE